MAIIKMIKFIKACKGDSVYFIDLDGNTLWTKETPEEILALIKEAENGICQK